MNIIIVVALVIFFLGLYFLSQKHYIEGYKNSSISCPNILIQKGSEIYLYNSKLSKIPGVNPLKFNNLNEYVEFTKWQRSQGIICPILFLHVSYDAQGNKVFKSRPSPINLKGGLSDINPSGRHFNAYDDVNGQYPDPDPGNSSNGTSLLVDAGHDDLPYNINSYPGIDTKNQNIGLDTPLDKMFNESKNNVSANPMDTKWGGKQYTHSSIGSANYDKNNVSIRVK